jgi:hypothetical protein
MKKYCKAYYLRELRRFPNWNENNQQNEPELSDNDVVYVWDDFTVVKSPVTSEQNVLFNAVTPEWKNFCLTTLKFAIPEDLRQASQPNAETNQENTARETSAASV